MPHYVMDDFFNKVEGMTKEEILALFENDSYVPHLYAGTITVGNDEIGYLYKGTKPSDALLVSIYNEAVNQNSITDIELDAINANSFSIFFIAVTAVVAASDGTNLYLNIIGERKEVLSSSSRSFESLKKDIEDGTVVAKTATYASSDISKGTIEERLSNLGFKEGVITYASGVTPTNCHIWKQGKVVYGYFEKVNVPTTLPYRIGTIEEEFRSSVYQKFFLGYTGAINSGNSVNIRIENDGNIYTNLSGEIQRIYFWWLLD